MARPLRRANERANEKIREVKESLCEALRKIAIEDGWTQKQLAITIGTSEANVSRFIRFRTEHLTINQLFLYLAKLNPNFKILIAR
ncbi:MAG: hypothetical protein C5B49_14590 [Bdellovibrio sp.]|nr:MAG: hypothetical protein C5B49_14590 [Bdellovibrio sp.]